MQYKCLRREHILFKKRLSELKLSLSDYNFERHGITYNRYMNLKKGAIKLDVKSISILSSIWRISKNKLFKELTNEQKNNEKRNENVKIKQNNN